MATKKQYSLLNQEIGRRIQISRENTGLTQELLAKRINRSTQFISTLERGLAGPSIETVLNICDALNVSTDWILRGYEASNNANSVAEYFAQRGKTLSSAQLKMLDAIYKDLTKLIQFSKNGE